MSVSYVVGKGGRRKLVISGKSPYWNQRTMVDGNAETHTMPNHTIETEGHGITGVVNGKTALGFDDISVLADAKGKMTDDYERKVDIILDGLIGHCRQNSRCHRMCEAGGNYVCGAKRDAVRRVAELLTSERPAFSDEIISIGNFSF